MGESEEQMTTQDKLIKAFFYVADKIASDDELVETKHYFHRTKKYAFYVGAQKLDENGYLPGEKEQ